MSCVLSELTALCDGALSPADRSRVEVHLAGCAPCREARDRIRATLEALSRLPPAPAPSPSFEQRFHARLAERKAARGLLARLPWRLLAPLAAAGAAAAIAAGVSLRESRQEEFLAAHLDLFESYEAVAGAGDLSEEDAEVVAHLDELEARP
jgi:anti-sigma factor RsiW